MPEKSLRKPFQGKGGDSTPAKFGKPHSSSDGRADRKPQKRDQCETPAPRLRSSCGLCHTGCSSLDISVATLSVLREMRVLSEAISELQILRPRVTTVSLGSHRDCGPGGQKRRREEKPSDRTCNETNPRQS